jgi:hypothetical protein
MKLPIKDDKCKKEFALWEDCYKNTYLSEYEKKIEIEKEKKEVCIITYILPS